MEQLGILVYGYNKADALIIKNTLGTVFNTNIILISGSGKESQIIEEILSDEAHDKFENKEPKMLMLLGFEKQQINRALDNFPGADLVSRPIFCTLTQNSITWSLDRLLQHLVEEKQYWHKNSLASDTNP